MKQVLQNFKSGELQVTNVPAPRSRPGAVVVRNRYSLISSGTEGGTVKLGEMNLVEKARARPEQVKKVLNVVRNDGVLAAYKAVTRSLEIPIPLGYSCTGEVVEVGDGVTDLQPGELVACGGAGWANHAEIVCVPRNLVVRLPEAADPRLAAFTTVGSIALQSVRVADVRLGENVVVIGLGLVGWWRPRSCVRPGVGCSAWTSTPSELSSRRSEGSCAGAVRGAENLAAQVDAWSGGLGADAVIVTASAPSNDPVTLAGELARHKARVVVVGRTEMTAPRETYLFKELELCTSMAYGPGTGDPTYEEDGLDYPVGYVRWTENRNMQAFVQMLTDGTIDLEAMVSHEFEIDEAKEAFDLVTEKSGRPSLAVLLRYPASSKPPERRIELRPSKPVEGSLGIGVIGAGSFATNFLVPLLAKLEDVRLTGIASANGVKARALGDRYGFDMCTSDGLELVASAEVDGVLILTRHDSHAPLTVAALDAGKHVFVEKPPALSTDSSPHRRAATPAAARTRSASTGGSSPWRGR